MFQFVLNALYSYQITGIQFTHSSQCFLRVLPILFYETSYFLKVKNKFYFEPNLIVAVLNIEISVSLGLFQSLLIIFGFFQLN